MWLKKVKLQTTDISSLKNFYSKTLELKVDELEGSIFIHTQLSQLLFETVNNGSNPFYHFAFNIPFNKVEEAENWLKSRVELIWLEDYNSFIAEFVNWNARSLYFYDPAGNIVELIGRADLNDITDEPFSSNHFRNISEIGLVIPKLYFEEEINQIMRHHQLQYFTKQKPAKQFCAIGDDQGLFICVPEGRDWYPTLNNPSAIFPMELKFESDGNKYSLELQ
jgi:hypothetical protein